MPPITFREVFLGNRVEFILGPLLARPFALLLIPANAVGTNRYVMGHSAQLVVILKPGTKLRAQNKHETVKIS